MTDSDFFELANRVVDGGESSEDREALQTVIGQSMSRRLEFEQLSALASILDAVRPVEPPEGLRNRILAAIPKGSTRKARAPKASFWQQITEFAVGRPVYALAYAAVIGMLIGVLGLVAVIRPAANDPSGTFGTMARVGETFSVADRARMEADNATATAVLLIRESEFVVEVEVNPSTPVEITVSPISEVATWYGVELEGGAKLTGARLGPDELRFPVVGTAVVRVSGLRADLGAVQCLVTIRQDDRVIGEMMLAGAETDSD